MNDFAELVGPYWPLIVAGLTGAVLLASFYFTPLRYTIRTRGSLTSATHYKPKAHFFTLLSVLWFPISGVPLLSEWLDHREFFPLFSQMFLLMILPHPLFIALALYFWIAEKPRELPKTLY